ncbi:MAG TPA: MerR family transcriptional regulator [Lachnospiraceae bacterium]|nr:MerR family transcriptional regulator [Lachnospiraceae bacterium]
MRFRIKEFADFCNVSVRALHLYDKLDLFHPSWIDEANGYRYYDEDQLTELYTIMSFRSVGFTLKEIKDLKATGLAKQNVINKLKEKIEENQRQIEKASYNIENLEQMLRDVNTSHDEPDQVKESLRLSKIMCLDNDKLENEFLPIIWL